MEIIIFGKTYEEANMKLDEIACRIVENPIKILRRPNCSSIIMYESARYTTVLTNEYSRGYRADKIYVPENVPLNIYINICLPMITGKLSKCDSIEYYEGGG